MAKLYYGDLHEVGGNLPDRPVDPGWGVDSGHPDQGLPSPPGTPTHPIQPAPPEMPPGVVWPPLFPEHPDQGLPTPPGGGHDQLKKVWAFIWIRGYGHRWVVLDISARPLPPTGPDQGLPPGMPGHPDQGLPGRPVPPPVAGQPLPRPPGAPPVAGQPLPPTPQPR
jgi:hypothetical protein